MVLLRLETYDSEDVVRALVLDVGVPLALEALPPRNLRDSLSRLRPSGPLTRLVCAQGTWEVLGAVENVAKQVHEARAAAESTRFIREA